MKRTEMSINRIRKILRAKFGTRKYSIDKEGKIHVCCVKPNTEVTGWFFFGHIDNPLTINVLIWYEKEIFLK